MTVSLKLAWRYMSGRGLRSALTTLAVVFGVMLIFGLNGVTPSLVEAFTKGLLSTAGKIDLSVTSAYNQPFTPDILEKVARVPGVAVATPEVQKSVPLPPLDGVATSQQVQSVNVIGVDPGTVALVREFPLSAGRPLAVGDTTVVVLASDLAARLKVALGDSLVLPSSVGSTRFTVVGLMSSATLPGAEQVFVPLAESQQLFALGARLTVVEASLRAGADRAAVEADVRAAVGADYTVGGLSTNSSLLASLQVSTFAFDMFGIFALATAGFIILNSFRTVVAERRRDIGMLRAIGTPRRTITAMFLIESVLQGVVGTALGILAGWGMAAGVMALLGPVFESVVHIKVPPVTFPASAWVLSIVLGIGVTVLAALVPARAAGRVTPMEAMRPQLGEVYARTVGRRAWIGLGLMVVSLFGLTAGTSLSVGLGAVVFLIGAAMAAPAAINPIADAFGHLLEAAFAREGAIARSNLQRNPGRSGITVTAVMLGLASIVALLGVVQAIFAGFAGYIDRSLSADYMVIPQSIVLGQGNVAAGPRLAADVRHVAGIGPVSTLRLAQGRVNGADVQFLGIDPATYPQVAAFEWNTPSSDAAIGQLAGGRWLIANGIFASQHNLTIGEQVRVDTPNGQRTYVVAGIGNDYLNAKLATVYVSQANLASDFGVTADLLVMADRLPSADPEAVLAAMRKVVAEYPAFKLYESAQWRSEQLGIFDQTMVIFYGLVAALAIPSLLALLNTLAVSVLGRRREIGMLRAVGATRRQVRRMVLAESLLLSIIGTVFGVLVGLWLGYALVTSMSAVGWPMPYIFPWGGVMATVVVGIGFGALAAFIPARSAARLNVVEALHQE